MAYRHDPVDAPAEGIVAVAFSMVQLFDTHFGQAVFGIVMVILGTAGSLFAAGTSVFVVAVFQSAEAEQLIKADQVLVAIFFTVSLYNDIYANIALSNFILIKIKIILIKYLYSCILPILLLIQKIIFFKIINHSLQ